MKELEIRLKELRQERDLTQQEMAKLLGVSRVTYSRYENGKREIPLTLLIKLADIFKTSIDYIVGRSDYWLFLLCKYVTRTI